MRIGVFDSGVGGLTVLRALMGSLPGHEFVYLGDTARVPYGVRSPEIIRQYALEDSLFLLEKNVGLIVVACNTASAHAGAFLKNTLKVPVIDVIVPGVEVAATLSKSGHIGIIGTPATVQSRIYENELARVRPGVRCFAKATPLLVPLIEEAMEDPSILRPVFSHYLTGFINHAIDTLILGCTHYPLLKGQLAEFFHGKVTLVDSADAVARMVSGFLGPVGSDGRKVLVQHEIYVTDAPERVRLIARRVLGSDPEIRLAKL